MGYNELPARSRRTVLHIVLDVMREPMFMRLIGAGAIYLVLGDRSDALMLLGFVAGLPSEQVMTGADMDALSDAQLQAAVQRGLAAGSTTTCGKR